jgi:hypothetical protein
MTVAEFVEEVDNHFEVSMVEQVLTQGRYCVAHLVITVPI